MTIDQLTTLLDASGTVYLPVSKNGGDYKLPVSDIVSVFQLGAGTAVSTGDLDTYLTPGTYTVADAATAANITNGPTTLSGYKFLVCQIAGYTTYLAQIAVLNNTAADIMVRRYNSSTWSSWEKVLTTAAPVPVQNGGTGVTSLSAIASALGIGGLTVKLQNISANYTSLVPFGNAMRGVLVTAGPSANDKSLHIFSSTVGGAMTVSTVFPGSNITVSGDNAGRLSIGNGGQNQITAFALYVQGS